MQLRLPSLAVALAVAQLAPSGAQHVVPGAVVPRWRQSWKMKDSSIAMTCNNSGPIDAQWGAQWGLVDLDWNGNRVNWAHTTPYMDNEEDMSTTAEAIKLVDPQTLVFVYRNGAKALPWFTTVRKLLEDKSQWGLFMPLAGCMPSPGNYVCGPNATQNLYHDFEQSPRNVTGDLCGVGVECGEYVFNHLNSSLTDFLLGDYFFGVTGGGNALIDGFYGAYRR